LGLLSEGEVLVEGEEEGSLEVDNEVSELVSRELSLSISDDDVLEVSPEILVFPQPATKKLAMASRRKTLLLLFMSPIIPYFDILSKEKLNQN
jgi:hypothetical protein